jgi:hypothetical protein
MAPLLERWLALGCLEKFNRFVEKERVGDNFPERKLQPEFDDVPQKNVAQPSWSGMTHHQTPRRLSQNAIRPDL